MSIADITNYSTMAKQPPRSLGRSIRRLLPTIIFPSIFFGLIYWDWNTTRKEKLLRERQKQLMMMQETQKA